MGEVLDRSAWAQRVAAAARGGRRPVVLIDGPAGAGKTSLARELAWLLPGREVVTVHMDDLYDGWGGLDDGLTEYLAAVVPAITSGAAWAHRRYDWAAGAFGPDVVVPAGDVLVIEGVGSGQPVLARVADLLTWVEADPLVCADRWRARDGAQMTAHHEQWLADQAAHFARYGTRARAAVEVRT